MVMSFGWIDAREYSFNALLLMDRWLLRVIADNENLEVKRRLAIALAGNPAVCWYVLNRCPERTEYYRQLVDSAPAGCSREEVRDCEVHVLDALDWAVVYVYPEIMDRLSYVTEWEHQRLLSITNFAGKTVLDIGSGTGRLAFAAAPVARYVYASEPVDRLREHLREKADRLGMQNVRVVDGAVAALPFPDELFDIVMTGHVIGDDLEAEWREMSRVTKPGGYVIDCPGEDHRQKPDGPSEAMIQLGFQCSHYVSRLGGDVYRYWRQKT
jgi:ubiquinone/menaquinone biosynthesis C-methylase UbiE